MHLPSMLAVCSLTQTPSLVPKYDQDKKYNDAVAQHVTMCKVPIQCNPNSRVLTSVASVLRISNWQMSLQLTDANAVQCRLFTYKRSKSAAHKQLADAPAIDRCKCCAVQTQHRQLPTLLSL